MDDHAEQLKARVRHAILGVVIDCSRRRWPDEKAIEAALDEHWLTRVMNAIDPPRHLYEVHFMREGKERRQVLEAFSIEDAVLRASEGGSVLGVRLAAPDALAGECHDVP